MMDRSQNTWWLVQEAYSALKKTGDVKSVQRLLASTAKALARALPIEDRLYDPDLDGPVMSPEEIKAAAVDARDFLWLVADLIGNPDDDIDWTGDDFAFVGSIKKRPGWKRQSTQTPAQQRRWDAAKRVYELMAKQCFDTGRVPKQEAAVAAVMQEFGMQRSKVMDALREYRDYIRCFGLFGPDASDPYGVPTAEEKRRTHWFLARQAMSREWFNRNPDAHFEYVPAGSALEKQLLMQKQSP